MTTPPEDQPRPPRQATIRARTRTNRVRPEVVEALDDLERSLGDVARWEQLLTGDTTRGPDWQRPGEVPEPPRPKHLPPEHLAPAAVGPTLDEFGPVADGLDPAAADLVAAIDRLDDRIDSLRPGRDDPAPDPTFVLDGDALVPTGAGSERFEEVEAPPLLWQARTVDAGARHAEAAEASQEELDRRRRTGRLLTITGVALLAALGGLFLLPRGGGDDGDPATESTEPRATVTVPVSSTLEPLLPVDDGIATSTSLLGVVDPTATTAAPSTTRPRTTATTKAPATTVAPATTASTAPLQTPGPTPTSTTESTTTTAPAATSSTAP